MMCLVALVLVFYTINTNPPYWNVCLPLAARDELLNPENDTIGILVSTAVEITIGGKTIKPAGGFSFERHWFILIINFDVEENPLYFSVCPSHLLIGSVIPLVLLFLFLLFSCWGEIRP